MKYILFFLMLFFFNLIISAQGIYETQVYDTISAESETYRKLLIEKEEVFEKYQFFLFNLEIRKEEKKELMELLAYVGSGMLYRVKEELNRHHINQIVLRSGLSQDSILSLTKEIASVLSPLSVYEFIEYLKESTDCDTDFYPIGGNKRKEFKLYELADEDKILQVGTLSFDFAKQIGRQIKNAEIYLSNTNEHTLNSMYYFLKWDNCIAQLKEENTNNYFVVKGSDTTTGIENVQFDKIIIRYGMHHFADKEKMLYSIKKSMTMDSRLIITIQFLEDCLSKNCNSLMEQYNFEALLRQNDFLKLKSIKTKTFEGKKIWMYKYQKGQH